MPNESPLAFGFRQALHSRRSAMGAANRAKSRRRPAASGPRMLYPSQYERAYAQRITEFFKPFKAAVQTWLNGPLGLYTTDSADRLDGYIDDLRLLTGKLRDIQAEEFDGAGRRNTLGFITSFGEDISSFNDDQWQKFMKDAIGAPMYADEPWAKEAIDAWASDNNELLRGATSEYIKRVNTTISDLVQKGASVSEVKKAVMAIDNQITVKRAKLIARDQTGKLQGQLTKKRQQVIGIDMYIWETAADERVRGRPGGKYPNARPSHWVMEGLLCRWDDSTVFSPDGGKTWKARPANAPQTIPGEAIQCRCVALPYFNDEIEVVDKNLGDAAGYDSIVDSIVDKKIEYSYVFDSAGKVIQERRGGKKSIRYTGAESRQFKDNHFLHNHPNGASFSDADLVTTLASDIRVMEAAGKEYLYTITRPAGGWPKEFVGFGDPEKYAQQIRLRKKVAKIYDAEYTKALVEHGGMQKVFLYSRAEEIDFFESVITQTLARLEKDLGLKMPYKRRKRK